MRLTWEGKNVDVFWSVNTPGLYYILDHNKISKEQFEELKFADALKDCPISDAVAIMQASNKFKPCYFGFTIMEEDLPKVEQIKKIKKKFSPREVEPLTTSLGDLLKGISLT
nr:MAG TPA: hypothetical protein [Caudoviricetes sp.]